MKTHATNCPAIASLEILLSPQRAIIYYTSRSISIDNCFSIHNYGLCSSSRGKKNLFMQTKYTKLCHVNPWSNQIGIEWKKNRHICSNCHWTDCFGFSCIILALKCECCFSCHKPNDVVWLLCGLWDIRNIILFKIFLNFFSKISWYVKEFYIDTKYLFI